MLDTVGLIEEMLSLCDEADRVLQDALSDALTRTRLRLVPQPAEVVAEEDPDEPV